MANLVPLYVDKENGRIVATNDGNQSPGTGSGNTFGYVHTQMMVSDQWVITHNKNTRALIYQIFNGAMEHVLPDYMVIDNENQITIYLESPMAGVAHLILFNVV